MVCIRAKVVVFWKSGCILAKLLYSGKFVLFGQKGCIWANWWCLGKVVVFGQGCCNLAKVVVLRHVPGSWANFAIIGQIGSFEQNSFIRAKRLYLGKVVVFGQKWLYSGKVVVFWQSGCI